MISDIDEIPDPKKIKEFNVKINMHASFKKLSIKIKFTKSG